MPRYFTARRIKTAYNEDGEYINDHVSTVCDHEAVDTGLIDLNGAAIMRAPNPLGFGKDDEWCRSS